MKKLVLSALALIGFAGFSIAQTAPAKTTAPAAVKSKMTVVKKDAPATTAKVAAMPATAPKPVAATTAPLKKDGTPDKRFKANQTPAGPVKKDGSPDKRFKANKKG